MRLWSLSPALLDRAALIACWREGLLAQKVLAGLTKGYTKHPQLTRFRAHPDPMAAIGFFLGDVQREASARGYTFNAGLITHPAEVFASAIEAAVKIEAEIEAETGREIAREILDVGEIKREGEVKTEGEIAIEGRSEDEVEKDLKVELELETEKELERQLELEKFLQAIGEASPMIPVNEGQIAYELEWLRTKVRKRDPDWLTVLADARPETAAGATFSVVPGGIEDWEKIAETPKSQAKAKKAKGKRKTKDASKRPVLSGTRRSTRLAGTI